jgi:hypothetical protein
MGARAFQARLIKIDKSAAQKGAYGLRRPKVPCVITLCSSHYQPSFVLFQPWLAITIALCLISRQRFILSLQPVSQPRGPLRVPEAEFIVS